MTVRVRYRATELMAGAVEDFPEADCWRTTEAGEVVLLASYEDEKKKGRIRYRRVGMVREGAWDAVVVADET